MDATLRRITTLLYWKGLKRAMTLFVKECEVCQRYKPDLSAYPGLLQPLPILDTVWLEVSMDFIERLPKFGGKEVIFVMVDRLSKYAILCHLFIPLLPHR